MTHSRTALVVEDDFIIRLCLTEFLEGEGFSVAEASGLEEVEAILDGGTTFDVLITDYYLTNSTGPEVVSAARKKQPSLPVIYISGNDVAPDGTSPLARHLTKPYALEDVLSAIDALTISSSR
ncbi:two hybrid sensor histidine kinase [Neokomagataea thailandica NBRC 106555]|uniref:Response regulator n=2 Tax=Neokomagataea TaxID=1223423 RepID=A0A4Y6V5Z7_9PROT|nr:MULTISPECIES: response regulator [Neokomagataea]QDH24288.1 response regulator [Neokomagataea tanensis]GBR53039.1 two hybrid sensor histidine kinase [Neokomagataea thailandica NBRC 106555]